MSKQKQIVDGKILPNQSRYDDILAMWVGSESDEYEIVTPDISESGDDDISPHSSNKLTSGNLRIQEALSYIASTKLNDALRVLLEITRNAQNGDLDCQNVHCEACIALIYVFKQLGHTDKVKQMQQYLELSYQDESETLAQWVQYVQALIDTALKWDQDDVSDREMYLAGIYSDASTDVASDI